MRRNRERETPEFASADDPRQGFAGRLAAPRLLEPSKPQTRAAPRGSTINATGETPEAAQRLMRASRAGFSIPRDLKRFLKARERLGARGRSLKSEAVRQATWPWQCLNFLPDPHGQGSFRPTRPQVAGFFGSRSTTATAGRRRQKTCVRRRGEGSERIFVLAGRGIDVLILHRTAARAQAAGTAPRPARFARSRLRATG